MNQAFLGDHRPAPMLRDMTQRKVVVSIRVPAFWFSLGVILSCIGFYLAGKV